MAYICLGRHLPAPIRSPLFGARERHGRVPNPADPDWQRWRQIDLEFYEVNQRQSVGRLVNNFGYRVMRGVELRGKTVLEIGPGSLDHIAFWAGEPRMFYALDINQRFLERAVERLEQHQVPYQAIIAEQHCGAKLPLANSSADIVISFYSLEHLHPLEAYLDEIIRVLAPGGTLVGAIPCEGGLAWGLGRFLSTRRWLKSKGISDPDKIICWEHPNFADHILNLLSRRLERQYVSLWPLVLPIVDLSLVARFIFGKRP